MKGIRRSLNKERIGAPTPTFASSSTPGFPKLNRQSVQQAPRPSAAPAPPKLVIRAISNYKARSPQELSFNEGDFFHVISDEGAEGWFDASNPMTGARGLVPASHFQALGRNVKDTPVQQGGVQRTASPGGMNGGGSMNGSGGGGGYPQPVPPKGAVRGYSTGTNSSSHLSKLSNPTSPPIGSGSSSGTRGSRPPSQPKAQPLYGIVMFDFVAERADELDAKRGEPIIVIAQSNHEWFVAKPIGRLGGPGLIPVAFVEIQDMTTGKPVDNVEELIRSAVVPRVEEWKKMTADYKSQSIPLGKFDFSESQQHPNNNRPSSQAPPPLPQAPEPQHLSEYGSYDNGRAQSQGGYDSPANVMSPREQDQDQQQGAYGEEAYDYANERRQYGLVTSASVESFHQEEGSFWFHLRAFFSTGASLVLYRLYQDFYDFQIALMDEFPVEAGRTKEAKRILPMMPGPTDYEDEVVCAQRVEDLSDYLSQLCNLPDHIRGSGLMYEFLLPRAGDVEVAPGNGQGDALEGQYGELVEYLDQMDGGGGIEQGMSNVNLNDNNHHRQQDEDDYYHQQQQREEQHSRQSHNSASYQSHSTEPSYSNYPPQQQELPPMGNANMDVPFVKIKIFHRNTDDLIAIRVPPTVNHASLMEKVRERLGNDVSNLRYREEVGAGGAGGSVVLAGGAKLVGLDTDLDLERWIRSGARLVLYAD